MKPSPVARGIGLAIVASLLAAIGPESPFAGAAAAQTRPAVGQQITEGMMYGRNERGEQRPFSLERTDVEGRIGGRLVEVTVTQTFLNPYSTPLDAQYVFPLPDDAAVHEMVMVVGDRIVRGEIHERRRAEEIYARARAEGRRAALLTEQRANVFTQSVANIGPRERILVRIGYTHLARRTRASGTTPGGYEVVFPMVVGPRYTPGETVPCVGDACTDAQHQNPPARRGDRVSPPVARDRRLVSNAVSMRWIIDGGGTTLATVASPTHALTVDRPDGTHASATLEAREVPADRDFVLRWSLEADAPRMSVLAHPPRTGEDGYVGLLLEPQGIVRADQATPRELLFVVDTSGSMSGEPLARVRSAMHRALDGMRPSDTFQILRFSSGISRHAPQPVAASREEVQRGHDYIDRMGGWGGTEMLSGVNAALALPPSPGRLRIVLFMTDGYIGNDAEVVSAIHRQIGSARLFSFGVGSSVNRDLLQRMADVGRGQAEIVTLEEPVEPAVERFYARIDRPNLTDVTIVGEGIDLAQQYPQSIPDVFADQPVSLVARYAHGGTGAIIMRGRVGGRPFEQRVPITLPGATSATTAAAAPATTPSTADARDANEALRYVWARARIRDLQWQQIDGEVPEVVQRITDVGLQYHLVTAYTSFVAVERQLAPADRARVSQQTARVALPAGLDYDAIFGRAARGASTAAASLSPARLQPGDPEILVHAPREALRVTATLPWGDEVECAWQPDETAWMGRFLVPRGTPDGTYRVNVRIVGQRGDEQRVFLFYRVDATAPIVRVQSWREGAFVVVRAIAAEHIYEGRELGTTADGVVVRTREDVERIVARIGSVTVPMEREESGGAWVARIAVSQIGDARTAAVAVTDWAQNASRVESPIESARPASTATLTARANPDSSKTGEGSAAAPATTSPRPATSAPAPVSPTPTTAAAGAAIDATRSATPRLDMRCYLPPEPVRGHVEQGNTRFVATGGGLMILERPANGHGRVVRRQITPCDGLPGADVRAVAIHDGRVHLAVWGRGIFRREDDGSYATVAAAGAAGLQWSTALASLGGALYVGTAYEGLHSVRDGVAARPSIAFRERAVLVLRSLPGGRLAIGRPDGLYLFRPGQRAQVRVEERGISRVELRDEHTLLAFGEGTRCEVSIDAGSSGSSCVPMVIDPSGPPAEARGPGSNHVTTLAVRAGRLLVGTFDAGIAETDGSFWSRERGEDAPRWVNHLAVDPDGTTWVGTATGAYVLRAGHWRHYGRAEGLTSSHVNAVARDASGRAWLATGDGLVPVALDGRLGATLRTEQGMPSRHVVSLGGAGALVAGTRFGLFAFDGDVAARAPGQSASAARGQSATIADGSLPDAWITAIHEGPDEWTIGTYARGLARGTRDAQGHWQFAPDDRAPALWVNPNGITRVTVPRRDGTSLGVTLVMTLGDGVWLHRDGEPRFVRAAFSDALPSNDVTAAAAFDGRLWIGTRAGLVSLPLDSLLGASERASESSSERDNHAVPPDGGENDRLVPDRTAGARRPR